MVAHSHSPTCFIVEDGRGDQMTLIDQGPMGSAAHAPVPTTLLRTTAWVHLTTGDPDYILRVKDAAKAVGCHVSVDPAQEIHYRWGRKDLERLIRGAEVFFGNESEARRAVELLHLEGISGLTEHVPLAIITRGPKGAVAYSREGVVRVPSMAKGRPGRVTGAGDAFRGGFYAGWLGGERLSRCLEMACSEAARWIRTVPVESDEGARPRSGSR
jgi:sugar/nucleoside kinase (ribokinase family)